MFKFVVQFAAPDDAFAFEDAYTDFLALVERMPNIRRRQVLHVIGSPQGEAPYFRALELYFDDEAAMQQALLSPVGQEAGAELARFGNSVDRMLYGDVYEEADGMTVTIVSSADATPPDTAPNNATTPDQDEISDDA